VKVYVDDNGTNAMEYENIYIPSAALQLLIPDFFKRRSHIASQIAFVQTPNVILIKSFLIAQVDETVKI
jgi:hypothetical protein